jgi:hypothetical protein
MVQVKYKGQNYVLFGRTRIVNGVNEIPDDEFYRLMKTPLFRSRIESGVFQVPQGTPLEKPKAAKKADVKPVDDENHDDEGHEDEELKEGRLSVKKTLKLISSSDDSEYLQNLIDTDDRQKVKDTAQKRLDSLNSEETK